MNNEEGTEVARGKHVVPEGVAVEELDGGKKKLSDQCPPAVLDLLERKGLVPVYEKMVKAIVEESKTRSKFRDWKSAEFNSVLDCFKDDFGEKGVKVAFCKRTSGGGKERWLEFIDMDVANGYVPQYDSGNYSGQTIKTCFKTLQFPNGVAVEELKRYGKARKKLKEKCPIQVEKILDKYNLKQEYDSLVDDLIAEGTGCWMKQGWNVEKLKEVKGHYTPIFAAKGVALFVSVKVEYISHGQYGGHNEYFRWLEFVDRELQPNYFPQRDADTKKECVIS